MMQQLYKFILKRHQFKGQDRLFNYLFKHHKLSSKPVIATPITGKFKIFCDPSTWIGAKIIYTGNYEPALKKVFQSIIKYGDAILDVGANIGFHTLYFAELTGANGSVIAFEPIPPNYQALQENIALNNFNQVSAQNIALSNKNEQITIAVDQASENPGAFNLFDKSGDLVINCFKGDEIIKDQKIDFIKIDVEGYESFVIDGLLATIKKYRPVIVFEYDQYYHQKTGRNEDYIFLLLGDLGYQFQYVHNNGLKSIESFQNLISGNVLALPHE